MSTQVAGINPGHPVSVNVGGKFRPGIYVADRSKDRIICMVYYEEKLDPDQRWVQVDADPPSVIFAKLSESAHAPGLPYNHQLDSAPWDLIIDDTGRIYPFTGASWVFVARYSDGKGRSLGAWPIPQPLANAMQRYLNEEKTQSWESGRADGLFSGMRDLIVRITRGLKPGS